MKSTVEQDMANRPVPRNNQEAFNACRDYQQSKGYNGLTQHEVSYIIGNKPIGNFINSCGPNVTTAMQCGQKIYSFKYLR